MKTALGYCNDITDVYNEQENLVSVGTVFDYNEEELVVAQVNENSIIAKSVDNDSQFKFSDFNFASIACAAKLE